jgi:GR25 family glycosyltransferase involved in LPS biosynthesis
MDIDCIYYINLQHRNDRREDFLKEMKYLGFDESKIHRIEGVYLPELGQLGCGLSHIKAIETFLKSPHNVCIIFEDDFQSTVDWNYGQFLLKNLFTFTSSFDLIMLSGNIQKEEYTDSPFLHRVIEAQTTAAYILTREFAPILCENFRESMNNLKRIFDEEGRISKDYCIDVYWKSLQPINKWFVLNPKLGLQRESFSDIEKQITNYRV